LGGGQCFGRCRIAEERKRLVRRFDGKHRKVNMRVLVAAGLVAVLVP